MESHSSEIKKRVGDHCKVIGFVAPSNFFILAQVCGKNAGFVDFF